MLVNCSLIGEKKTIDTSWVVFLQMHRSNSPGVLLFIVLFRDVLLTEGKSILELRMTRTSKLIIG